MTNVTYRNQEKLHFWAIFILIFILNKGFKFTYWPLDLGKTITGIVVFLMVISWILGNKRVHNANFSGVVLFFSFMPFFSIINSLSIGESFSSCIIRTFTYSLLWSMYFLLHIYDVRERTILNVFGFIGFFYLIIQVVQQFTYPFVLFGGNLGLSDSDEISFESVETRNGILRFRGTPDYGIIFAFFLLANLKGKYKIKYTFMFIALAISVYFTLTRQVIASFLLVYLFSQLREVKKNVIKILYSLIVVFIVIFLYYDTLFGEFTKMTNYETNNENNIRILAASYFWNDSLNSILTFLLGYGFSSGYETNLGKTYLFFPVDVGFIGAQWKYGIVYVSLVFSVLYKLFQKNKKCVPLYIRYYVLFVTIIIIMIFPMGVNPAMTIIWPCLLYICDLHINKSPLAIISTKH